jgi:hypothetical protein
VKVFVLEFGIYDERSVAYAFSSKEKAEEWLTREGYERDGAPEYNSWQKGGNEYDSYRIFELDVDGLC